MQQFISIRSAELLYAVEIMKQKQCPACTLLPSVLLLAFQLVAQQAHTDIAAQPARPSPAWLKSGVIYEVFERSFSPEGNFQEIGRAHV